MENNIYAGDWVVVDFTEGVDPSNLTPGKGVTWQAEGHVAYVEKVSDDYVHCAFVGGGWLGVPHKHIVAKIRNVQG